MKMDMELTVVKRCKGLEKGWIRALRYMVKRVSCKASGKTTGGEPAEASRNVAWKLALKEGLPTGDSEALKPAPPSQMDFE